MNLLREYIEKLLHIKISTEGLNGNHGDKDFFSGSKFGDLHGREWYVEEVLEFVQKNKKKYFREDFPVSELVHDYEYWQGDEERAMRADTRYPLLVLIEDGELSVADGLNRMWRIVNVEKKDVTDVYLVPKEDIEHLGFEAK